MITSRKTTCLFIGTLLLSGLTYAQKPRARDIGIPFNCTPTNTMLTDVEGLEVAYSTIITGSDKDYIVIRLLKKYNVIK